METNKLHHFKILYETQHLRKAAELLHISHAGLSKSIKSLEEELGLELFRLVGRNMESTDHGERLYGKLPEFFDHLESLKSLGERQSQKPISIGSFEVFSTHFFASMIEYDSDFKDHNIVVNEFVPGEIEKALVDGDIDIGITYHPIPRPGVEFDRIARLEMVLVHSRGTFKSKNILDLDFAAPAIPVQGSPTGVKGLDSWPDHELPRRIVYRVDMMEAAVQLCRRGLAVMYLPKFLLSLMEPKYKKEFQLIEHPLNSSVPTQIREVFLVKRVGDKESKIYKKIARSLRVLLKK